MGANPLHEIIKCQIVEPALGNRIHPIRATVQFYNNYHNTATIRFKNPFSPGEREMNAVPVQIGSGGVHAAGPFPGDQVWVQFLGGNMMQPRIVSLADEDYVTNTRETRLKHQRQGTMIPAKTTKVIKG